jgi:signal recognition particle subunit SRP68
VDFTNHRCFYLARCYAPVKRYAEALTLIQLATIYLRETVSTLSLSDSDPISTGNPSYYPLTNIDFNKLESDLTSDGLYFKKDWFAYNGGSSDGDAKTHKKPLFFNIALNYVQLDTDRLQERAGKQTVVAPTATPAKGKTEPILERKQVAKTKIEEVRAASPEPQAPTRGGLSTLLGGWWGKN